MAANEADLAHDRVGYLTGFRVKPKRIKPNGEEPSMISFTIETPTNHELLSLLGKIQESGETIAFGIEPLQSSIFDSGE